jgi:hypothetical protein
MPRKRRAHEDYLEAVEPIGVVVLNDVTYLLQDVSEIVLDLGKLLRDRRDEVMELAAKSQDGPAALGQALPPEFLPFLFGSVAEVVGVAMQLKASLAKAPDGGAAPAGPTVGNVDLLKVQPEMLETVGRLMQKKAEELEAMIANFEAGLLRDKPPPA